MNGKHKNKEHISNQERKRERKKKKIKNDSSDKRRKIEMKKKKYMGREYSLRNFEFSKQN